MAKKRTYINRLNDLTPKEWIKFQKSWFVHHPPRRKSAVLRHPGKFPETLIQEFIEFFTKTGGMVLDPMVGTGSTLVAALKAGRHSFGVELNPEYAQLAGDMTAQTRAEMGTTADELRSDVFTGDAAQLKEIAAEVGLPPVDYLITSPPYWDMLRVKGFETQHSRREDDRLDVYYSDQDSDLGNIRDYDAFLDRLTGIYTNLQPLLKPRAYLTVIVKNLKKKGKIYPLAWDLASRLGETYVLKDEKIWCQDNQRLAPYGMGNAWVSNIFHHYCLQFRNEP